MKSLAPVEQRFVLHWGEMGIRWGINRTVAQIHALLFLAARPLNAEEIADTLGVARSNVSNSLRELQGWGIVRRVHRLGDRRDHFETLPDVWELFRQVADERKKRELDPTLAVLRDCLAEARRDRTTDAHTEARLGELLNFFETTTRWYDQVRTWPLPTITRLAAMGEKVGRLLGLGGGRNSTSPAAAATRAARPAGDPKARGSTRA